MGRLDARIPEPELMDEAAQAEAYARADFEGPNEAFVEHLRALFPTLPTAARVLDLGCGPADIPVRLARRHDAWTFTAVDGAGAMLRFAREAVDAAGLGGRIELLEARVPTAAIPRRSFDVVVSNSLLHHLPDPSALWRTARVAGRQGAAVLVMDLVRPETEDDARAIVDAYARDEPEVLRHDFFHSLRAAFRPGEVRDQLRDAGLPHLLVDRVSDRHLLVHGIL